MVRLRVFMLAAVTALIAVAETAQAHPVHMSFTEVRSGNNRTLEVFVRVFADDFSTAAARYSRSRLDSGQIIDRARGFAYLTSRLQMKDSQGSRVVLSPCGVTRVSETLRFCLRASVSAGSGSYQLSNTLLTELFDDQVNVVQSVAGKRRDSRMFVRGDGWKRIGTRP